MASSVPFHYVDLRAFCYATEDERRVADALRTYLPDDEDGEPIDLDRTETEGFHGDRILVVSVRLERADEVRYVLSRLAESPDLDRVLDELDERVDEDCTFFLSLDKQAAFRGTVALGEGITLRSKVEAYPARKTAAVENVREMLTELLGDGSGDDEEENEEDDEEENEEDDEEENEEDDEEENGEDGP